jgi:hypothetical protein
VDGQRVALIQANIGQGSLGAAVRQIQSVLRERVQWPADMRFRITGQNEEWERSQGSLYLALGLSLFLVYVIMASQFESLVQPLIIMATIPLAFFGSVVGLSLLGYSISIVVFLGLIMLAGIVVNNAIVLVDYANTLRGRGLPLREAIITAGGVRLRPILMTTSTTVLGLLPMALGLGDGAEIRTPMAVTVICGLFTSTALTLIVIPSLYYTVEGCASDSSRDRGGWGGARGRMRRRKPGWRCRPSDAPETNPPAEDRAGHLASGLTEFSLRRRITVLVLLLAIIVVGWVASIGIPVELFPRGFHRPEPDGVCSVAERADAGGAGQDHPAARGGTEHRARARPDQFLEFGGSLQRIHPVQAGDGHGCRLSRGPGPGAAGAAVVSG